MMPLKKTARVSAEKTNDRICGKSGTPGRFRRTAVLLCLLASWTGGAAPPNFVPGQENALDWKPTKCRLPIYLPPEYTPGKKWPVVFFYHGLNGQPSTAFIRHLTGGKGVIVVGMEYLERGLHRRDAGKNARYNERELAQLTALEDSLEARLSIDRKRLYVAGVSKGGWQVSRLVELGLPRLAGAMIVLAGRIPNRTTNVSGLTGKPIYIGDGERDKNTPYARMAVQFFARCGARVTWEEYPEREHEVDPDAPRLNAWARCVLVRSSKENHDVARSWLREQRKKYATLENQAKQARFLADLTADPRFRWCAARSRRSIRRELDNLRRAGKAAREWNAKKQFENALWKEQTARSLRDLKQALAWYEQCAERYPKTPAGKWARKAAQRVAPEVEESESRMRHALPGVPHLHLH